MGRWAKLASRSGIDEAGHRRGRQVDLDVEVLDILIWRRLREGESIERYHPTRGRERQRVSLTQMRLGQGERRIGYATPVECLEPARIFSQRLAEPGHQQAGEWRTPPSKLAPRYERSACEIDGRFSRSLRLPIVQHYLGDPMKHSRGDLRVHLRLVGLGQSHHPKAGLRPYLSSCS